MIIDNEIITYVLGTIAAGIAGVWAWFKKRRPQEVDWNEAVERSNTALRKELAAHRKELWDQGVKFREAMDKAHEECRLELAKLREDLDKLYARANKS